MEIFKDILGYKGFYQISNLGRVKSLKRHIFGNRTSFLLKEKMLKTSLSKNGYVRVVLCKNCKSKTFKVHQLVAIAFLGHNPCGYNVVVDHIDNNRLNNNVDNLQLITQRENSSKDKNLKTSQYTGVAWRKSNKKWESRIRVNGKKEYLGQFENEIDAHKAYQKRLQEITFSLETCH